MTLGEFRRLTEKVSASVTIVIEDGDTHFGIRSMVVTKDNEYLVIDHSYNFVNSFDDVILNDGETILYQK